MRPIPVLLVVTTTLLEVSSKVVKLIMCNMYILETHVWGAPAAFNNTD
jgi:hypothetical protein